MDAIGAGRGGSRARRSRASRSLTLEAGARARTASSTRRCRRSAAPSSAAIVATNAAGAATFKYGSTRDWVRALTVVLATGDVLDLERGECRPHADGCFEVARTDGARCACRCPATRCRASPKRSAGYHAGPEHGPRGPVRRLGGHARRDHRGRARACCPSRRAAARLGAFASEAAALAAVARAARAPRAPPGRPGTRAGIDVASIESLDRRCLALLREDGMDREHGVASARSADTALLFQAELPRVRTARRRWTRSRAATRRPLDTPLTRLCRLLREHGALDSLELALPGDARRARQLQALREARAAGGQPPHRRRAARGDPGVHKAAADMIVPFEQPGRDDGALPRGASRGAASTTRSGATSPDGNIHANAIPRTADDVRSRRGGDPRVRRGGDAPGRLPDVRARRRPQPREAGAAAAPLRRRGHRADARGQGRARPRVEAWRRACCSRADGAPAADAAIARSR